MFHISLHVLLTSLRYYQRQLDNDDVICWARVLECSKAIKQHSAKLRLIIYKTINITAGMRSNQSS